MSTNDYRKCAKCGRTRAEDTFVSYHRFPNPGKNNITKALAWAKYCWPNEDWTHASLLSLHTTNKVLCGRHFALSQFYDNKRQKLSKFAVPDSAEVEELLNNNNKFYSVLKLNVGQPAALLVSRMPFAQIENIPVEPSTSAVVLPQESFVKASKSLESTYNEQNTYRKVITPESAPKMDTVSQIKSPSDKPSRKRSGILSAINVSRLNELTTREKKLYNVCRGKLREIIRLRNIIKNKKHNFIEQISADENVQKLCDLNISNSFIVLLQSQLRNCPKKPKGRRYTLNQKIMSLVLYKKSPACYRLLRRMFALPCQSSLNKLLNRIPLKPGINKHIFSSIKKMANKQSDDNNICILSFDEMSIRKHLYYDTNQDKIQGFQDHGNHGRSNQIASKALVFMLAGIRKKWKQPIAFYFSHTINADRMSVILKEIITECFNSNVNLVATVCDLSTVNVKVLKMLGATTRDPYFVHCEREIVAVLDPPHLLKCTRNLLLKHDVECTTEIQANNEPVKGIVKWSHIDLFYNLDKNNLNFVFAPALTEHHLKPNIKQQMRVKLAAQVFSHSVTAGILAKIASNELPPEALATATFTKNFDELFDAVNADSPDLRGGKKYSTNMTLRSPHIALFQKMRKFILEMKYLGSKSKPPSQDGWIHTLNAIERLWKKLQSIQIKSLSTRRLNQDPLENCFGCIRYNCGSNNNPTIQQFVAGVKTAILSNLRHSGQRKNCEDDTAVLCDNLSSFLTNIPEEEKRIDHHFNFNDIEALLTDAVEAVEQATPESQACGYVCGFIYKKLRHNDCPDCRKTFLSDTTETIHIFTNFKEYDVKNALNYANNAMIQCVEIMATLIQQYLKDYAWKENIQQNILTGLDIVDFSFLSDCPKHLELNKQHLKSSTFYICIKRFIVLKNREMDEEEKKKAVERKIRILKNK